MDSSKLVVRRLIDEVWNQGKVSTLDQLVDSEYVDHAPVLGQPWQNAQVGVQGFKQVVSIFHEAFPDLRITVEQQIAEGD